MKEKYQVAIWWSERDEAFLAMAPQLPQCIADGPTHEAALAALDEVVGIWLEMAEEDGWPIPQPPGTLLPVENEFDWKPLPEDEVRTSPETPPTARRSIKPKTARRVTTRSTHVTTENIV
jgi:predicted RNase H-like HicB family nuclease